MKEPNGKSGSHPKAHSEICQCKMCMKSRLSEQQNNIYESGLKSSMVDRRAPDDLTSKPLMKATIAHSIIKAGTTINMLEAVGMHKSAIPSRYDHEMVQPYEITIPGAWRNKNEETARSGKNASVFGSLGVLLVPAGINALTIPKMNALSVSKDFLKKYGAELIPLDTPVNIDAVEHAELEILYLVQYDFDKDYIEKYVMHAEGGGGLFVETHPFPHVFTPLSPDCGGALILGIHRKDGQFDFTSFQIPFGFTMKIASNVIHGDSFFVGPYAIALTDSELADSVIFKQETLSREIQPVNQQAVPPLRLPILAEYRLARAVNFLMMTEKFLHERASRLNKEVFIQKKAALLQICNEPINDEKKNKLDKFTPSSKR